MSENTSPPSAVPPSNNVPNHAQHNVPPTNSSSPFSQMPPRPQHTHHRPTGASPPPPPPHAPPPGRSFGCGRIVLFGLALLGFIGVLGICTLFGAVLIFSVASQSFSEITAGIDAQEVNVTEKVIGGNRQAKSKVAVVTIEGMIVGDADGFIARQIRKVESDKEVKAVVLRVDSPGGTMAGSDYYHYLLKKMKKERNIPIVVSMGTTAASGGYYVSMVGDEIFAEPSTLTGSIGVIASLFDASELFEKIGVEANPIVSGKFKNMGSFTKPMSDEERELFQQLIDENFERFKDIIKEGRRAFRNNPEALDELATGQIFTANQASKNKLIDKIGFIDDAVEQAGRLANMGERDYKVVQYKAKLSFMDALLESRAADSMLNGTKLFDATVPRIYLLSPYVVPVGVER